MMVLMDCSSGPLGVFVYLAKQLLNIMWIMGPILAIVSLTMNISLLLKDPEDKKRPKKIKNSVMALLILFFVPTIVNAAMQLMNNDISTCWKSANMKINQSTSYTDDNNKNKKNPINNPGDYEKGKPVNVTGDCAKLQYCKKYITSLYENSQKLNDTILKNNASVIYSNNKDPESWEEALKVAEQGKTLKISCNRPTHWSMRDITGEYRDFYSLSSGGFKNYAGPMTNYTEQLTFDGSMTVKKAIQKGLIQTGDIIGTTVHTFTIYSVNQKEGSAVVFDGGHRFTSKCQERRECSTMFTYSADTNADFPLYQIIRWVK